MKEKAEKECLTNLVADLKELKLYAEWTKSSWAKSANDGSEFYKKRIGEIDDEVKRLTVLKDFSDITNTKSLAYWTIHNKPSLTHEQESVLFNLNAILIEKPESIKKDTQYIPSPEIFFDNLIITHIAIIQIINICKSSNSIFSNSDLCTTNFRLVKG